jgi:MFS family permease
MSAGNSAAPVTKSRIFYGYYIIAAILFIMIMMWGSRQSFSVLIGPLLDEFHWSRASVSAGFSATWVFTGIFSILVGRLNDRFGPRLIMTVAGCLLGLGFFLISTLTSLWQLFLYYLIINIGMSAAMVPVLSTIARWFVKKRGFVSGIAMSGIGIALITLIPIINEITISHGWRTSYTIISAAAFVIIITAAQFLKRDPSRIGDVPDGDSSSAGKNNNSYKEGLSLRKALRTRQVWTLAVIYLCCYFTFNFVIAHLVLYARGEGISATSAATIISVLGAAGIAGRILIGIWVDKVGNKIAMLFSTALMLISFSCLLLSSELWMLYLFGIIYGFGQGGLATAESPMVAHIFGMKAHGSILGVVFAGDTIGGTTGPIVGGYIFDRTQSYLLAFIICVALVIINLLLILGLKPVKQIKEKLTPAPV